MTSAVGNHVRSGSRAICQSALVMAVVLWSALVGVPASAQAGSNIAIDYTGALFGYFRNDGPTPGKKLEAVQRFLERRNGSSTLLLGMGDNFAPELGAALQYDDPTGTCLEKNTLAKTPPERFYKDEHRVAKSAACDNVAGFLLDAGYRALVPGREDFIYSARWLQQIARMLKVDRKNLERPQNQQLVLLASNLRLDAEKCPLLFADKNSATACVESSGDKIPSEQDWVTRLDLTLTEKQLSEAIANKTAADPHRRLQMTVNEMKQLLEVVPPEYREELKYFATESAYKITENTVGLADPAKLTQKLRGIAQGDCTSTAKQKDLCLLAGTLIARLREMPAKQPVFLSDDVRAASERLLLRNIAAEQLDIGYTFDQRPGIEGRTLIVGVVGPEMMDAVSPTYAKIGSEKVKALEPVATVVTLMRAACLVAKEDGNPVARTIIMAQMQHTDAEEFGTRLRIKLAEISQNLAETTDATALHVDLILTEAQPDRATSDLRLDYQSSELIPVVTPRRAFNVRTQTVDDPISTITLTTAPGSNRPNSITVNAAAKWALDKGQETALELLLKRLSISVPADLERGPAKINTVESMFEKLAHYVKADVVLLPRRDIYFGALPDEYAKYEACGGSTGPEENKCRLRVALDRVLWKGDYFERVMMSGQDLKKIIKAAQQSSQSERNLAPQDITGQWLYTFGIVTNEPDQLTRLEMNSERYSLPQSKACVGDMSAAKREQPYCINGTTISDDASYWVVTTDSLAHDDKLYSQFSSLPSGYHQPSNDVFFTSKLEDALEHEAAIDLSQNPTSLSISQQYEELFHVDIAKWVAGFSIRHPVGGNAAAARFQGVADSRASQTTQQELDLESTLRVYRDVRWKLPFSIGNQTILEYDRSVQGNLAQKPITANYALNNFSTNLFFQKRIPFPGDAATAHGHWANREVPRTLIVLTPIQYQQQVVGSFLYFSHSAGSGQQTVALPRAYGYSSRIGLRHEIGGGSWWKSDRGSYFEVGWQFAAQYNVLESVTLFTGAASLTCNATGTETIPQCFGNNKQFPIDGTTTAIDPATGKKAVGLPLLHATGWYWDARFQKGLWKDAEQYGISLSLDSKGDLFNSRHAGQSLSTQTRYAFPIASSINFPILRNFSLSPTYTAFFYENQVAGQTITVNTFSITAKWFYDRDSRVPLLKQIIFRGPASLDQTKTAKMK